MEAITYRTYVIKPSEWFRGKFDFHKIDYNGEVVGLADTIAEAKDEIDYRLYLCAEWPVKVAAHTEPVIFNSLASALNFISKTSAVPLFEFNSI